MYFIVLGILSIFQIYQGLGFRKIFDIPVLRIAIDNNWTKVINGVSLNWCLYFGIYGLLFSIVGYIFQNKESGQVIKIGILVFYILFSFTLIL